MRTEVHTADAIGEETNDQLASAAVLSYQVYLRFFICI